MKSKLFGCCVLGLLALYSASASAAVSLRAQTELHNNAIRLSDVFDGLPEGKDCDIAISPAPGKSVTYEVRVLNQLAQRYNLEWKPASLADRTLLMRAATRVTPDMVRDAVLKRVSTNERDKNIIRDVQFDGRNVGLNLPAESDLSFDIVNFVYDEERRMFRGELVANAGGYPVSQVVSGRIILKREIPVLARSLPAGTVIGAADLKWISVNDERIGDDILTNAEQIVGMELRRVQNEDERLRLRDIMPPRLVTRGSLVTIKVETPLMLITAQGRALQDGAKGETVRIVNTQSNRTIEGVVEATGIVRVGDLLKLAATQTEGAVR